MSVTIRDSRPEEFDALWKLDQECFPRGIAYSRRELAWYMKFPGAFTLVAEADHHTLAGFLVGNKVRARAGHIVTIDVSPKVQRKGVGSQLMAEAEARFRAADCNAIFLEAAVNNAKAIGFYKKLGYFVLKVLPRYYNGELDGMRMAKRLE